MFPVSPVTVIMYLVAYALAGMALGALSGWLTFLITKLKPAIGRDLLLGGLGFLATLIGVIFVPWPTNTVVEQLKGGGTVATTMNQYQHPERVAVVVAIVIPALYEFYRARRTRTKS